MSFARAALACLVLVAAAGAVPLAEPTTGSGKLRSGMTPGEVRGILGPPRHVARQVLYQRYLEQWVYDTPNAVRLEFDVPRGQPARLLPAEGRGDK